MPLRLTQAYQVQVVNSFSWLTDSRVWMYQNLFIISQVRGTWVISNIILLQTKLWKFMCIFSFLFGKSLEVECLGHMECIRLTIQETAQAVPFWDCSVLWPDTGDNREDKNSPLLTIYLSFKKANISRGPVLCGHYHRLTEKLSQTQPTQDQEALENWSRDLRTIYCLSRSLTWTHMERPNITITEHINGD